MRMVDIFHHPKLATIEGLNNIIQRTMKESYHVLPTLHGTLQYPSYLLVSYPRVEWVERDDISAQSVEIFVVHYKVPLISGCDSPRRDFIVWIPRLRQPNRTETNRGLESNVG